MHHVRWVTIDPLGIWVANKTHAVLHWKKNRSTIFMVYFIYSIQVNTYFRCIIYVYHMLISRTYTIKINSKSTNKSFFIRNPTVQSQTHTPILKIQNCLRCVWHFWVRNLAKLLPLPLSLYYSSLSNSEKVPKLAVYTHNC